MATSEAIAPPVALLAYAVDDSPRVAFSPFAVFSPEWKAINYALAGGVFFFQAEDGIRDLYVTGFRRVLFRSFEQTRGSAVDWDRLGASAGWAPVAAGSSVVSAPSVVHHDWTAARAGWGGTGGVAPVPLPP